MTTFHFEARNPEGSVVRGIETAMDEQDLDLMLEKRGLLLVTAKENRERSRGRATARTMVDFCHHLATILAAGIPLLDGLRDLQEEGRSPIAKELEDVVSRVASGRSLSSAMESHPTLFPVMVRSLVDAGEETGSLDVVLSDLASYLEWRDDLRRQLKSAAIYPCIVVTGLVGLVLLILLVVLPKFLAIFVELRVTLPLPTRALLALHGFVSAWGLHLLAVSAALAILGFLWVRTEAGRRVADSVLLHVPVLGKTVLMVEMSRLCHNLGLLYASGVPITRCLELVEKIVQNRVLREIVTEARDLIARGETLTGALGRGQVMPSMVMRMVSLGERSGRLDESLDHVARYYDREIPYGIDRALALINTGVVIALGATLGTVALAIFVPMYEMMGNLNG